MKDLNLTIAIEFFHKSGDYVPFEKHNQYELVYYHTGHGTTLIGENNYTFSKNTFVIIPPHVSHNETHYADCNLFFLQIQTDEKLPAGLFTDDQECIYKIVRGIVKETQEQHVLYKDMILIRLNELYVSLIRLYQNQNRQHLSQGKSFEYIINYITEHYHDKILFKNLAKQMNYSYDYFQHRFKELTGNSPQQYLIQRRLEEAEHLLENTELSCTDIAYRCGFSNSAQFSSIFKRENGISPQQYRKIPTQK